jgi:hypothetical protein
MRARPKGRAAETNTDMLSMKILKEQGGYYDYRS